MQDLMSLLALRQALQQRLGGMQGIPQGGMQGMPQGGIPQPNPMQVQMVPPRTVPAPQQTRGEAATSGGIGSAIAGRMY